MPLPFNPSEVFKTINAVRILTGSSPDKSSRVQDYDRLISRLDDLKNSMMEQSSRKPELVRESSAVEEGTELPTTEETIQELKRRLGKELYRIELDLQGGGRIANRACDCLSKKHHLGIEATAEELMSYEVNPIYNQIIEWLNSHATDFEPSEIVKHEPSYYQALTPEVRAFRKSVMGTETLRALLSPSVVDQVERQAERIQQGEITQEEGMSELEEGQKSSQYAEAVAPGVTGKLVTRSYRTPVGIVVDYGIQIGDTVYEPRASAVSPIGVSEAKKGWSEISEKDRENYRGWEKKQGVFGRRARAIADIERCWDEIIAKGKTAQEHAKEQLASYESYMKRRAEAERQYFLKSSDLIVDMTLEEIATGDRYVITEITDEGSVYARPENEPTQSGGSIGKGEIRGYRLAIQRTEALLPNAEAAPSLTFEQFKNWEFAVPKGGSSKTPKMVLGWAKDEYETLADLAKSEDTFRFNEVLGKGWESPDVPNSLKLATRIRAGEKITIYRASDVGDIIPGSYVSESLPYVQRHGEVHIPSDKFEIYKLEVYPDELMTYDDPHEFIYIPRSLEAEYNRLVSKGIISKPTTALPNAEAAVYPATLASYNPPPFIMYHAAPASAESSIAKRGLIPSIVPHQESPWAPRDPVLYMANSMDKVQDYAAQASARKGGVTEWNIYKIEYPEFPAEPHPDLLWGLPGTYYTDISIPASNIKLVGRYNTSTKSFTLAKVIPQAEAAAPERVMAGITSEKQLPKRIIDFDDVNGITKYEVRILSADRVEVSTIHTRADPRYTNPVTGMTYNSLDKALASIPKTARKVDDFIPKMALPQVAPTAAKVAEVPSVLRPLADEAVKYDTFEEFERAFIREIKHGRYYHITDNPNFTISPETGPRDMSSMAGQAIPEKGKLMITSDLDYWAEEYKGTRQYVAIIDMGQVPKGKYWQVNRGFGNEFWVDDPSMAKVIKVVPIKQARIDAKLHHDALPGSPDELKAFFNKVKALPKAEASYQMSSVPSAKVK